ncbi:MAG: folate family ECF transporter S component [Clostridia bacterium]|nr:folate family ECF transporter S component [Clostridia bacterium]
MKTNTRDLSTFRTPLTPAYWRLAWGECRSLKSICLTAILVAICGILDIFFIPIVNPQVLQIKFSFFAVALCAMVCGPVLAVPAGFLIDTLGFLLGGNVAGGYFFGYAISSICSCLIFALCFYRARKITVWRSALAKFLVSVLVNVLLGSVWRQVMVGKGYWYYVGLAAVKNAALLPLEVAVLVIFLQRMVPLLKKAKIISPETEFSMTRTDVIATAVAGIVGIAALGLYVVWKLSK